MKNLIKKAEQKTVILKFNYTKINGLSSFQIQVDKVADFLAYRYNFEKRLTVFKIGLENDDFYKNKATLKIILKRYVLK